MNSATRPARIRSKPSLRARVVQHVLWPLALTWLLGTGVTVGVAYFYAQKAFDRALLDDAFALASRVRREGGELSLELSNKEMGSLLFDQSENIFFVVRLADGSVLAGHPGLPSLAPTKPERVRFEQVVYQGRRMQSVTLAQEETEGLLITIAQTTGSREALLKSVLVYSVVPQLLLLVWLAFWLRRAIGKEMRPLAELEQSLEQRDALDLTPVPVGARSSDLDRLADAVNALLARVDKGMRAQRELSGNVAHELRTPLAGIRALASYGLNQSDPNVWREQLSRIVTSEARASRMIEQLLALAFAEEEDSAIHVGAVRLDELVREVVLRYLPQADATGVDLGVQGLECPVTVRGNVSLIEGILGNLIDNALRYGRATEGASLVTAGLFLQEGVVKLSVTDNGPGMTKEQYQLMRQRGARGIDSQRVGHGAGLGLAIVAKFAQVMHADFELGPGPQGVGVTASVAWPTGALEASI